MSPSPKITPAHRDRQAYIYIRQSTLRQVAENQESQALQYQLAEQAERLGWSADRIVIIDEDLGKSGARRAERYGFERLFTDIGTGKVGILLVTDVSRLARNCADWYQLLDVAAYNAVLVSDSGGIYDPRAFDDRLLLGVKGAFSEAQWHIMRQQMQAARLNKAKRGELHLRLPVGLERLPNGAVILTPDEQVQGVIGHLFRRFSRVGSCRALLAELVNGRIQLPRRVRTVTGSWQIVWEKASYSRLYQFFKSPAYAGAYAYGKREKRAGIGSQKSRYGQMLPPNQWQVLLKDAFPAYISWEDFMANQKQLAGNWQETRFANQADLVNRGVNNAPFSHLGYAGKGAALLVGLVVCAHCGRRMTVRYRDKPAYVCDFAKREHHQKRCQYVPYAHADRVVVAAFLDGLEGSQIELALTALRDSESQQTALEKRWADQLARVQYEVDLARTRYLEVDPKMRLVAAELERAWEEALAEKGRLEAAWEGVRQSQIRPLTAENEQRIRHLATNLPALWQVKTTTASDRKRLLRTLIRQVTLDSQSEPGLTTVTIRWENGVESTHQAARPKPGHPSDPQLLAEVTRLLTHAYTDAQIAAELNQRGIVSSWHIKDDPTYRVGQPVAYWTARRVGNFRRKHKLQPDFVGCGFVTTAEAAKALQVSISQLLDWQRRGLLPGQQQRRGAQVWFLLDEALVYRLSQAAPRTLPFEGDLAGKLVPLSEVESRWGLSAAALREGVQTGLLVTWRLAHGAHSRWYVQRLATVRDDDVEDKFRSISAEPAD
jgi:DNA invertase Pin-like site-specific DNA recombinase